MFKFIDAEKATFQEWVIPKYMWSGIDLYLEHGIKPGHFLSAVICNDMSTAVGYADDTNIRNLPAYSNFFYNYAPSTSWGSKEKMEKWMMKKYEENRAIG
jgi:hypothetical protein